jgi:tuftelin-interacting protein 11
VISRLQQIHIIATNIDATAKELSSFYEISLDAFEPHFQKLINEYASEFEKYKLDEIVVGAIAPLVKRMSTTWKPLEDPTFLLPTFRSWRIALKVSDSDSQAEMQINKLGSVTTSTKLVDPYVTLSSCQDLVTHFCREKPMTPFESLLWNVWLPKVRTALNNDWSPADPQPAVKLCESWSSFLPTFIRDNILDQLILPKIQKAIADWNAKKSNVSLQAIVFPWLPYVGLRLEDVVGDARRKIKSLLRAWVADEAIPSDLSSWREVRFCCNKIP